MAPHNGRNLCTIENKRLFLKLLQESDGFIHVACSKIGLSVRTLYNWKNADADFSQAWDEVVTGTIDLLEHEAYRRASKGEEKTIWYQGQPVGKEMVKSDALLMWMINNKKGYSQKTDIRMGGLPGAPAIGVAPQQFVFHPENLTLEEQKQLQYLLDKAAMEPDKLKAIENGTALPQDDTPSPYEPEPKLIAPPVGS